MPKPTYSTSKLEAKTPAFLSYGTTLIVTSEALIPTGNHLPIQTEEADQKAFVLFPLFTELYSRGLSSSDKYRADSE